MKRNISFLTTWMCLLILILLTGCLGVQIKVGLPPNDPTLTAEPTGTQLVKVVALATNTTAAVAAAIAAAPSVTAGPANTQVAKAALTPTTVSTVSAAQPVATQTTQADAPEAAPKAGPETDTPQPPSQPLQPTPAAVTGGGTWQDGPFTFDFRLYRDPALNQNPAAPSLYSDMTGQGAYLMWVYHGPRITGPVMEFWGIEPTLAERTAFPEITDGMQGGRDGGIIIPADRLHAGERLSLRLQLQTTQGVYGAKISFTLREGANGMEADEVQVSGLE